MGNVTGIVFRRLEAQREQELTTDDKTLVAGDSATDQNIATDEKTYTLPLITADNLGMEITFRNTGADAAVELNIEPSGSDSINGTIPNAASDSVASGVAGQEIINTKATANKGDYITLTAAALTEWYVTGGVGIWA